MASQVEDSTFRNIKSAVSNDLRDRYNKKRFNLQQPCQVLSQNSTINTDMEQLEAFQSLTRQAIQLCETTQREIIKNEHSRQ